MGRSLQTLSLHSCVRLSNRAAASVGAHLKASLTALNLRGCLQVGPGGPWWPTCSGCGACMRLPVVAQLLAQPSGPQRARIPHRLCTLVPQISDEGLAALAPVHGLKELSIQGCQVIQGKRHAAPAALHACPSMIAPATLPPGAPRPLLGTGGLPPPHNNALAAPMAPPSPPPHLQALASVP